MALFLWLIILLAIAWGLADFQLQSRIEAPPPAAVPKSASASAPPTPLDVAPPVVETPASASSAAGADAPPAADPASAADNKAAVPAVPEGTRE